jgi:hypothetical protein
VSTLAIANNRIVSNNRSGSSSIGGVDITAAARNVVVNNNVIGNLVDTLGKQKYGIRATVPVTGTASNNVIVGNDIGCISNADKFNFRQSGNFPTDCGDINFLGDKDFYAYVRTNPIVNFDANDYLTYDRSYNQFNFLIGSSVVARINATQIYSAAGLTAAGAVKGASFAATSGGADNKAVCWKAESGGSRTLGYCSTAVDTSGSCTCN